MVTLTPIIAQQTGNLVGKEARRPITQITEIIGVGTHDYISHELPHLAEETEEFSRAGNGHHK